VPAVPPAPKIALWSILGFSSALVVVFSASLTEGWVTGTVSFFAGLGSFTAGVGFSLAFTGLGVFESASTVGLAGEVAGLAASVLGCVTGTVASTGFGAWSPAASVLVVWVSEGGAVVWLFPLPKSVNPRLSSIPYFGKGGTCSRHTTIKKIASNTNTLTMMVMIKAFLLFSAS
jgi:hypothetical protein